LLAINRLLSRKSLMLCCDVQRGPRKREVFAVPKKPKAPEGHLPTVSGMEPRTCRAPRKVHQQGWWLVNQIFLLNYDFHWSSDYVADTLEADYRGMSEEAVGL
jgi:hypothetical protein